MVEPGSRWDRAFFTLRSCALRFDVILVGDQVLIVTYYLDRFLGARSGWGATRNPQKTKVLYRRLQPGE